MSIDKEKLIKLIDDNLDIVYTDEDMDRLVKVVNEIIKLFTPSPVKEKLYRKALETVIKDDYDIDKYGTYCLSCNSYTPIGQKVRHNSRNCRTKHIERILAI